MRILSVTAQKPDSTGSGVYLTELVKGFEKSGHKQAVLAGVAKNDTISLPEQVEVYPVYYETGVLPFSVCGMSDEMPYQSTRYCDMTKEMTEQFSDAFMAQVDRVIAEFKPDIVLCHHLYYLTAMIRERYPQQRVYGICHGSDLRQIKKNPWQREYIKTWISQLDGIFALHKEQKANICGYYGCEEERVGVIGTGYNRQIFKRTDNKSTKTDELRLIFAGKISEKKGVKSLINSMTHLSEAGTKVALSLAGGYGNVKEYEEIAELATQCPCEVRFLGKLTQTELAEEINQSDVFVLPSFYEGLPLVIVEAMACGANVVCTDLPGIQDWISEALPEHQVVFVEPPKMRNEDEPFLESLPAFEMRLAEAVLQAKEKQPLCTEQIERLSWEGLCEKLIRVWNECPTRSRNGLD